jgi:hypothetical protein
LPLLLLLLAVLLVAPLPPVESPPCEVSAAATPARLSVRAAMAIATRVLRLCKTPPSLSMSSCQI